MKRAATTRPEMRSFLSRMNEQQVESVGRQMYEVITIAVDNMDKNEKVLLTIPEKDAFPNNLGTSACPSNGRDLCGTLPVGIPTRPVRPLS